MTHRVVHAVVWKPAKFQKQNGSFFVEGKSVVKILKNYILNENVKKRLRSRGLVYVNGDMREHVPPRITLEHVFPLFLLVY